VANMKSTPKTSGQAGSRLSTLEEASGLATHIEHLIGHEIQLLTQRFSGLVFVQSILFGAFVGVLASEKARNIAVGKVVLRAFPAFGIVLTIAFWMALRAARKCMRELGETREEIRTSLEDLAGIKIPKLGHRREGVLEHTRWQGDAATFATLFSLIAIWIVALVFQVQVSFL
jgi:hypothetical protein